MTWLSGFFLGVAVASFVYAHLAARRARRLRMAAEGIQRAVCALPIPLLGIAASRAVFRSVDEAKLVGAMAALWGMRADKPRGEA